MKKLDNSKILSNAHWEIKGKLNKYPSRRWGHSAVLYDRKLVIFGGKTGKVKQPVYKINCDTFECETIQNGDAPITRESHSCSLINNSMIIWGGCQNQEVLNDCYKFMFNQNGGYWQSVPQFPKIKPRESHASTVLKNKFIFIHGGSNQQEEFYDDFYIFNTQNQLWHKIKNIRGKFPSKSGGSLQCIGDHIFYFGGETEVQNQYLNDIYKMHFTHYRFEDQQNQPLLIIQKIQIQDIKPQKRSCFASVHYKQRYIIVIGGQGQITKNNQTGLLNDVWCFDTIQKKWVQIKVPNSKTFKPRSAFTATLYKNRIMIFGGLVPTQKTNSKSSDQLIILWLQENPQINPITCNICKFSFCYPIQPQQSQKKIQQIQADHNIKIGIKTFTKLSGLIKTPIEALSLLIQNFNNVLTEKMNIWLNMEKYYLLMRGQGCNFTKQQLQKIITNFDFQSIPFVQNNRYLQDALKDRIWQVKVGNFSAIIKTACMRLGKTAIFSYQKRNQMLLFMLNQNGVSCATIDFNKMQNQQQDQSQIFVIQKQVEKIMNFKVFLNMFNNSRIQHNQTQFTILITELQRNFDNTPILHLQNNEILTGKTSSGSHSSSQSKKCYLKDQLFNLLFNQTKLKLKINEIPIQFACLKRQLDSVQKLESQVSHKFSQIKLVLTDKDEEKGIYYVFENRIIGKYGNKLKLPIKGFFKLPQNCPLSFYENKLDNPKQVDNVALPIIQQFQKQCKKRKACISVIQLDNQKKTRKQF